MGGIGDRPETPAGELAARSFSRILVNLLSPIGDTLFATPTIAALRRRYPKAYLAAVVYPTNYGILEGNPDLDEIFLHPVLRPVKDWLGLGRLVVALRRRRFDLAVDLNTFEGFLSRVMAGVPNRVRLALPPGWWLRPGPRSPWADRHAIEHYLEVVADLGIDAAEATPRFIVGPQDRDFAQRLLAEASLPGAAPRPRVVLHPGGEGFGGRKRWPAASFAALGRSLTETLGAEIILVGGPDEKALGEQVSWLMGGNCLNTVGQTTLKQLAALAEASHLFIGNDSAPLHIAAALGVPVIGIYGPSSPANFGPRGSQARVARKEMPCSPCFHIIGTKALWQRVGCRRCHALEALSPQEVVAVALELLTAQGPASAIPGSGECSSASQVAGER